MYGRSQLPANTINLYQRKEENLRRLTRSLKYQRYSLCYLLLVLLFFLALLAINPSKEAAEARNLKRSADISTILTYVSAYTRTNREF